MGSVTKPPLLPALLQVSDEELTFFLRKEKAKEKTGQDRRTTPGGRRAHGSSSSGSSPFVILRRSERDRWAASRPVSVRL